MRKSDKTSGFTMVEIVAVLVIIGIMVAVAAPRFVNMAEESRNKAAIAGVSECKATLSVAYAKAYLEQDGVEPTVAQVMTAADLTDGQITFDGGDVRIAIAATATGVNITPISVKNVAVTSTNAYVWTKPEQN